MSQSPFFNRRAVGSEVLNRESERVSGTFASVAVCDPKDPIGQIKHYGINRAKTHHGRIPRIGMTAETVREIDVIGHHIKHFLKRKRRVILCSDPSAIEPHECIG